MRSANPPNPTSRIPDLDAVAGVVGLLPWRRAVEDRGLADERIGDRPADRPHRSDTRRRRQSHEMLRPHVALDRPAPGTAKVKPCRSEPGAVGSPGLRAELDRDGDLSRPVDRAGDDRAIGRGCPARRPRGRPRASRAAGPPREPRPASRSRAGGRARARSPRIAGGALVAQVAAAPRRSAGPGSVAR